VAVQFSHEALTETHDFAVALAFGIKVGTALGTAHGQGGQAVLEDLLETEELDDAQVDGGVQAQSALVGSDGGAVLDAETAVNLDLALVIHPRDAEDDLALRLDHAVENAGFNEVRATVDDCFEGFENLGHGLNEFRLGLVSFFDRLQKIDHVLIF